MIKSYVTDLAKQMNVPLSTVSTEEGDKLGCLGVHMLNMSYDGKVTSALIYQSEFDSILNNEQCDRLELKVRIALDRLKIQKG
ncbi:MAG: hypothetical protein ACOYL3_17795 [Desulfuromonadaceae bacterium]